MILLFVFFLFGCQAEHNLQGSALTFPAQQTQLSEPEKQQLQAQIKQLKQDVAERLMVSVPTPMEQSQRYTRALWESRKHHMTAYLVAQGITSERIEFRECSTCSAIQVNLLS